jgi:predicted transcriptional regulator
MRRTQIYLGDDQAARLDQRAAAQRTTRSTLIRRAVDEYLERDGREVEAWNSRWRRAVERSAGVAPYLAEGEDYVEGLRTADARRLEELGP